MKTFTILENGKKIGEMRARTRAEANDLLEESYNTFWDSAMVIECIDSEEGKWLNVFRNGSKIAQIKIDCRVKKHNAYDVACDLVGAGDGTYLTEGAVYEIVKK